MPLTRNMVRSEDAVLAGVCGGIADFYGWDAGRFRMAYVIASIFSAAFPGIIVYLLLLWLMPGPETDRFRMEDPA